MPEETLPKAPPPTEAPPPEAPPPGPPPPGPPPPGDGHRPTVAIEDEMRRSYLDYSMSVIIGRALPDARDGLKPVHRRILYAMHLLGNTYNRPFKKCARIVGDCMGKFHPHGNLAIYDALARLAQDWNMRAPLVDPQGNFGSIDGDPPAAERYTEARLARLADFLLADIDEETVEWGPNFDGSIQEPLVLPARFPNLLVNGSSGIAVGMATNVPPHNLKEVVAAAIHLVQNPKAAVADLMRFVPGPDFPTAGIILGRDGIQQAYQTGRGAIAVRARVAIEVSPRTEREFIVVTEIPYQVNKARLVERIAELARDRRIEGIADLRDESSREGMRVVVELKRDAVAQVVLNNLYQHTDMQTSFGVTLLAIDGGQPRILSLKALLERFVAHRRDVVTRRTRFELRQARAREHVLLGFQIALDHLDEIVELIKKAPDGDAARDGLMRRFELSEIQAKAILELQLRRLTGLERRKILEELAEVQQLIARLKEILASEKALLEVIVKELEEVRDLFGEERRTEIRGAAEGFAAEDLIAEEEMVVTVSHLGYVKRNPASAYRAQRRGGRGKTGAVARDEDFVEMVFVASTHSYLLVFSDRGKVYWLKVHEIPQAGRAARGKPIVNLVQLAQGEKVAAILPVARLPEAPAGLEAHAGPEEPAGPEAPAGPEEGEGEERPEAEAQDGQHVFLATRRGLVKRTRLDAFSRPRPSGIIALSIEEGDELIAARLTDGASHILLSTAQGKAIQFEESDVRPTGRTAYGVKGVTLEEGDEVVSAESLPPPRPGEPGATTILTVTRNGYGKRSELGAYRTQSRGGKGIITIKTTERNGPVVSALPVQASEEVMLITNRGMLIRLRCKQIGVIGRITQGVCLIALESKDEQVMAVTRVAEASREVDAGGVRDAPDGEGGDGEAGNGDPGDLSGGVGNGDGGGNEGGGGATS